MNKDEFFALNLVHSVHLLYKIGQFSSILSNKSIISIPTAPKLHQERRPDFVPSRYTAVRISFLIEKLNGQAKVSQLLT